MKRGGLCYEGQISLVLWLLKNEIVEEEGHWRKVVFIRGVIPLNFLFSIFVYSFFAGLGLQCCTRAFSSCKEQGLLSNCSVHASHRSGFSHFRAWAVGQAVFSSGGARA